VHSSIPTRLACAASARFGFAAGQSGDESPHPRTLREMMTKFGGGAATTCAAYTNAPAVIREEQRRRNFMPKS
jgi:hypothetical protein